MGRVSLTEDYDDRSVIAKLNEMDKRVKENAVVVTSAEASAKQSAQAAQETADRFAGSVGAVVQNANAQINASKAQVDQAKAEVDEAVTTVAQAVQTANNASASAQASAQTVAGYDTRLTAVEGHVTTLETADKQNVKISGAQTITGIKTVPTEAAGVRSKQIANSLKIGAELDAYETMVRTVNAQIIGGPKQFIDNLTAVADKGYNRKTTFDWLNDPQANQAKAYNEITDANDVRIYIEQLYSGTDGKKDKEFILYNKTGQNIRLIMEFGSDGKGKLLFRDTKGATHTIFQEP